jgi:hypothetical protein
MLRMCVYMHSRFIKNHPIRILKDGPLIYKMVLSQHAAIDVAEADTVQRHKQPSPEVHDGVGVGIENAVGVPDLVQGGEPTMEVSVSPGRDT